MSWSKHGRGSRGYHHGNLKEALIRAALELIAQKGPAGFTFAEAARWAGVSPAAPYRHFRDRDELLSNVALRGFQQFEGWVEDTAKLLAGCPCESGCPSCVQSPKCGNLNEMLDKGGALTFLRRLAAASA